MDQDNKEQYVNPLLDRARLPGETFRLPSGGIFYTNGELRSDVQDGEVTVYPMTAIDDITIKTPDLLYSGKAIEEVFKRCIPQVTKPKELLARDVDFLLICLRKVSVGPEIVIEYTHTCDKAEEHSYVMSMEQFIRDSKRIDPTTVAANYSVALGSDQMVKLQPIRYNSFVELMQLNENDQATPEEVKDVMFKTLLNVIISVDEVSDKQMILEWLNILSSGDIKKIQNKIEDTTKWGPSFISTVTCKDCGEKFDLIAPLNPVAFFT